MNKYEELYCKIYGWYSDLHCAKNKTEKERIKKSVRSYMKNIDSDLYIEFNEGAASGLLQGNFFDSDMENIIKKKKNKINHESNC